MPLNEMLGNQTETQLWALEMIPIGFQCDDKPIQVRRKPIYAIMTTSQFTHLLSTLREIKESFGGTPHLSIIPLKNFHMFKIVVSVINFYLKKISKLCKMFYHSS